jgi:hypothetical protein
MTIPWTTGLSATSARISQRLVCKLCGLTLKWYSRYLKTVVLFYSEADMAESKPSPRFEHVPNRLRPAVIESYCVNCGLFVGASSTAYTLELAELSHKCTNRLKFVEPQH